MTPEELKEIISDQQLHAIPQNYFIRDAEIKLSEFFDNREIIILMGLRRTGKSILLHKVRSQHPPADYYFSFEDERLIHFETQDFQRLLEVFSEVFGIQKTYYFDEVQNIPGWEYFIRRLHDQGAKIYLTGSNATLFSQELGTRLTGRYIPMTIYPFSFKEFFTHQTPNILTKKLLSTEDKGHIKKLFEEYYQWGGIPEYLKHHQPEYLSALYESIIFKDILARYKPSHHLALQELAFYLASNCSKEITYNSLKKTLKLGSATTVSEYCSYLESSYLCFFVPQYYDSLKAQMLAPKKCYFIDHALAKAIGFRFSEDRGRILENIIFIELKRLGYEIYYHKNKRECDFIIRKKGVTLAAIQVCVDLQDPLTFEREISGLTEACMTHQLKKGIILTLHEEKTLSIQNEQWSYICEIIPIWKWLLFKETSYS